MEPKITTLPETKLIGKKVIMSYTNNKNQKLWQSFMPRRAEIKNTIGSDLYAIEIYDNANFFKNFDPTKEFEKWAAVQVTELSDVPNGMETLAIPEGLYAVFHYKGKSSEAQGTYQFIYGNWIPNSEYQLDNRPHFALMGEKYKNDDPSSEEELWIPINAK